MKVERGAWGPPEYLGVRGPVYLRLYRTGRGEARISISTLVLFRGDGSVSVNPLCTHGKWEEIKFFRGEDHEIDL